MLRLIFICKETYAGAVFSIPLLMILNKVYFRSNAKMVLYAVFSLYISAIYALVGMPNITYIRLELNVNLLPFIGMLEDLKNSILNVLLFVPLGVMLPVLCAQYRGAWKKTTFTGFGVSVAIELLQILTLRATDVNDVLTNGLGTLVGYLIAKLTMLYFPGVGKVNTNSRELLTVSIMTILVMFFFQPFVIALV